MVRVPDWAFEAAGQETRGMVQDAAAYHPGLYLTPAQVVSTDVYSLIDFILLLSICRIFVNGIYGFNFRILASYQSLLCFWTMCLLLLCLYVLLGIPFHSMQKMGNREEKRTEFGNQYPIMVFSVLLMKDIQHLHKELISFNTGQPFLFTKESRILLPLLSQQYIYSFA